MRWTLKLVAEIEPGRVTGQEIASFQRGDRITPARADTRARLERLRK